MKTYELVFDENLEGITRVSMVKDPAVESTLIKFSEENAKPLFFANEEKRIIYAVALRPNKLIFRKDVSKTFGVVEPANVFYSKETAGKLLQNYFKNNNNKASNINHEEANVSGVYPFEAWQVENPELDKSKTIGLETFEGDVVMAFKVENDTVWEQVKAGDLDGLSIEAHLFHKEVLEPKLNKVEMSKKKSFAEYVKSIFMAGETPEVAPDHYADNLDVGSIVTDKDGNILPDDSFEVDGVTYETDGNGAIVESEKMAQDPKPEDPPKEDPKPTDDIEKLKSENEDLKKKIATMEAEKIKSEADMLKMAKDFAHNQKFANESKPKAYEDMTNIERMKFNKEKN